MTIIAERESVKISSQYMTEIEIGYLEGYENPKLAPTNPGNNYKAYKDLVAKHHCILENVVDVLNYCANITNNAQEGVKVIAVIKNKYQSVFHPEINDKVLS